MHFAKTKFVLHARPAVGGVHRYIYKAFKEGKFSGGLSHHKLATLKAALAAAFAYHELELALIDAHGTVDPAVIQSAASNASAISAQSASHGQPSRPSHPHSWEGELRCA